MNEYTTDAIARRLELLLETSVPAPPAEPPKRRAAVTRAVRGGRVLFFPAAEGVVRIVGVGPHDEWIAEFCCLEADFREEYLRRMERHIARKTGARIALVG